MYTKVTIERITPMGYRKVKAVHFNNKLKEVGYIYGNQFYSLKDRWHHLNGTTVYPWKAQIRAILNQNWSNT